ncbi:glycoside hydrolase family protein [Candidatus Latescibacterota bacterium]
MAFTDRLLPAPVGGGYAQDDYWIWCGSGICGDDGRYHLFASRWPRELPFFDGYKARSEVARASAETPEGPYTFEEVVLPDRGSQYWDGRMTHNPSIHRWGDTFLVEDPYIWYAGDHFEMLAKDWTGYTGQTGAGLHALSENGMDWELAAEPQAYSRRVLWDDGTETEQGHLELPQVLNQDGVPTLWTLTHGRERAAFSTRA